jgi:hypothetical protein
VRPPDLPYALRYLWNHFALLHRARTSNGFGPNPIAWGELSAYCTLMQVTLVPWEVEAIRALDDEFLASIAESMTTTVTTPADGAHG